MRSRLGLRRLAAGAAEDWTAVYTQGLATTTAAADRMLATAARLHVLGCALGQACPVARSPR